MWNLLYANRAAKETCDTLGKGRLPEWLIPADGEQNYQVSHGERILSVTHMEVQQGKDIINVLFWDDSTIRTRNANELLLCRQAIDSVTDLGLMALDLDGRVVLYNASSAIHDGTSQEAVLGARSKDWFSHQTQSTSEEVLRTGCPVIDQQIIYRSKSGKENYCFGGTYPIQKNGKMIGVFSVIRFNDSVKRLLTHTIELQKELLATKNSNYNGTKYYFSDIIAESPAMLNAISTAKRAAFSSSSVLLYGETGTGKELLAQGIHNAGPKKDSPFIAVNCAAIPDNLLESTLFGTVKGAFTGAQNMVGLFEQAGDGTLFLDEINSMPLDLQAKLLRVLQKKYPAAGCADRDSYPLPYYQFQQPPAPGMRQSEDIAR